MLNKAWGSLDTLVSAETAGSEEGAAPRLLDQPLFIYVTTGAEVGAFDKIEKLVLTNDKVCIGMWAFRCVKMSPDTVRQDSRLAPAWTVDRDRGFIFVSRDMQTIDVIGMKRMSAKTVLATMEQHAQKAYKGSFEKTVEDLLKVLTEFDRINNQRRALEEKEARASEQGDTQALEDIATERAALDAAEKQAKAKRDELLAFELKEAKAA